MKYGGFLFLSILMVQTLGAQNKTQGAAGFSPDQCTIGYYIQDSVAMRMQGFKPLFDTAVAMEKRLKELQNKSFLATDRALMMQPDSGEVQSAADFQAYKAAHEEAKQLEADVKDAQFKLLLYKGKYFQPYHDKIKKVADTIAREKGIKVFETNSEPPLKCPTDQTLMIDITRDIGERMGLKMHSFRIGIINRDSLMRLMPGYAIRADSTSEETRILDSITASKNMVIARKQQELDSLRPTLTGRKISQREEEIQKLKDERDEFYGWRAYNIDKRHEERSKVYVARLNIALTAAAKENGCKYYYDRNEAIPWTEREAEFIDLNLAVSEKLKL